MSKMDRLVWLNGKIIKVGDAKINVLSPTAQFGANVFEGLRCYWNDEREQLYGFRLSDHYLRLMQSVKRFGLEDVYSTDEYLQYMKDIVKANNYRVDIAVRQTVFVDGFGSWFSREPIGMFIAPIAKSRKKVPLEIGEKVCISTWERISEKDFPPSIKVGANYINSRHAKLEATVRGFDSALFLNRQGYIAEGTGSCFFIIKGKRLITPALTESILESITRDTIIKIAKQELGINVEERKITVEEAKNSDEAFFCGSAVEISPIIQLDDYPIGNGCVGDITRELHRLYLEIATGNNEKYFHYLTPIY